MAVAAAPLRSSSPVPADGLLHPIALGSLALLVLNDQLLKAAAPGWWTGKLSDVAGLVLFPVFLVAGWELVHVARRGSWKASRRAAALAALATAAVFTLVELVPAADAAYETALGWLQWPARAALAALAGHDLPPVTPVAATADPTDLLALPTVFVALAMLWRRARELEIRP
jgi:hypothetical protein